MKVGKFDEVAFAKNWQILNDAASEIDFTLTNIIRYYVNGTQKFRQEKQLHDLPSVE